MRKRYGESRIDNCPFCGKIAVVKNSQGVPVCQSHRGNKLTDLKCVCGEYLDLSEGKWGPYFRCMNCGNISFKKGLDMNTHIKSQNKSNKKEIRVTSDQLDYLY